MQNNTVVAISTPLGEGGISTVRISGEDATYIADRVFKPKNKTKPSKMQGYTASYGKIYDGEELLDDAICLVFKAPKSYTGEDIVELSVHGGVYLIKRVLRAVTNAGGEIAQPGEFTKRAFLNGKMSLTEAESVMNVISAGSSQALHIATMNREGALSKSIKQLTDSLLFLVSQISVFSDFPEDDTLHINEEDFIKSLEKIEKSLKKLTADYDKGKLITKGINTVIVGSPNAGKSTLMNLLSRFNRSIVTPIAGTTRDVVEQTVSVGEYTLNLADTAGIHSTLDEVEKIGIEVALNRLDTADLCLGVFDTSKEITKDDKILIEKIKDKNTLIVLNKNDLPKADGGFFDNLDLPKVSISALKGEGEDLLIAEITKVLGLLDLDENAGILGSERQFAVVSRALNSVISAKDALCSGVTLDAVGILIDDALSALLELDGKKITSEVADEVFKNFCVGK